MSYIEIQPPERERRACNIEGRKMSDTESSLRGTETKLFDPQDASPGSGREVLDASVIRRDDQWWMYLAGQSHGYGATQLFSASLDPGAPLSASGWKLNLDNTGELAPVAGQIQSRPWDGKGGRHCPSYVRGWDPHKGTWVERIYYAGAAENLWGPYTIGFLERDGEAWIEHDAPAFAANEEWELGSVYEPNLIYHDGKWKMWYVAGSNGQDHLVHGYAESDDGRTGWSVHTIFAPPEMKMFDFCVRERAGSFDAIFARVWVGQGSPPAETGLWWCRADTPSGRISDWSVPVQIMTAADRGWHSGPWKPSLVFDENHGNRALVFFDGLYRTDIAGGFPFAFTLGCLEIDLPIPKNRPEAWMRGIVADVDPVIGHLIRATEQILEDTAAAIADLTPAQIWAKPHGMTSVGFHVKHLAGSTERLSAYLAGGQLTPEQLAAIDTEGAGAETAAELLAFVDLTLERYRELVRSLSPKDFGAIREIGRKRYQTTTISVAIHTVEHAQRHVGGMIAAAKLVRD
jgi:hypothetical protein